MDFELKIFGKGLRLVQLSVDTQFERSLRVSPFVMEQFEALSGDDNKLHKDRDFAIQCGFRDRVAYGNILGLLISSMVGVSMASYSAMLVSQSINYRQPVYPGEFIVLQAQVTFISESTGVAELRLQFTNQDDQVVATGKCQVKCLHT